MAASSEIRGVFIRAHTIHSVVYSNLTEKKHDRTFALRE